MNFKKQEREKRLLILRSFFGNICWYCGIRLENRIVNIDHIRPRSTGGTDELDNLALACGPCNYTKGMSDLDTFYDWIQGIKKKGFCPKNNAFWISPFKQVL